MDALIGTVTAARGWCIEHWWRFAEISARQAGLDPQFVLLAGHQDPTPDVLLDAGATNLWVVRIDDTRDHDAHDWADTGRYERMVELRNQLLHVVRDLAPPMFLSLDSDILLHPEAFGRMTGMLDRFDAAGSACFLSGQRAQPPPNWRPACKAPNYALLSSDERLNRNWQPGLEHPVDVLMAIKLMQPAAYQVDYGYHRQGEDIGWSKNATGAGLNLGWTSKVVSKHLMSPWMLDVIDPRCGY